MATQLTIRATVIEGINGQDEGFPTAVRVRGAGSLSSEFVEELAQEAIDSYYGLVFAGHRYAPNLWSTDVEHSDDMVVPVEYIPAV